MQNPRAWQEYYCAQKAHKCSQFAFPSGCCSFTVSGMRFCWWKTERIFVLLIVAVALLLVIIVASSSGPLQYSKSSEHDQHHDIFVGSEYCGKCHKQEFQQWQKSDHAKSMMPPETENVLGDFDDKEVVFDGVKTRFTTRNGDFFITTGNSKHEIQTYKVKYTFGYRPLQQYLIDIGDGKLQAFDIAWDSRPADEGGQHWFKLLPDEDTGVKTPLHWTKHLQNWNSRCAQCHSTSVSKGYDPIRHRYNTTFSEVNVACEACHGPGKKHVTLVQAGAYKKGLNSGFVTDMKLTRKFVFDARSAIAKPQGVVSSGQINACGGCHSRRQVIGRIDPGKDYHDQFMLS